MKYNTPTQNEQQLKNFDLSEYRQVIFSTIIVFHQQIIQQIQDIIKVHIVPAILDYDEMARGKQKGIFNPFSHILLVIYLLIGRFVSLSLQANVFRVFSMSHVHWSTNWTISMNNSRYLA